MKFQSTYKTRTICTLLAVCMLFLNIFCLPCYASSYIYYTNKNTPNYITTNLNKLYCSSGSYSSTSWYNRIYSEGCFVTSYAMILKILEILLHLEQQMFVLLSQPPHTQKPIPLLLRMPMPVFLPLLITVLLENTSHLILLTLYLQLPLQSLIISTLPILLQICLEKQMPRKLIIWRTISTSIRRGLGFTFQIQVTAPT